MRLLKVPATAVKSPVTALALDDNSERLYTASEDGVVRVWDVKTLREVSTLEKIEPKDLTKVTTLKEVSIHQGVTITCLALYGDAVITGDVEGSVFSTDINTGDSTELLKRTTEINDLAILGDMVLVATMSGVATYDMKKQRLGSEIPSRSEIRSLSLDPSKAYLITIAANRIVSLFQVEPYKGDILYKKITIASQTLASINDICRISWAPTGERIALPNINLDPTTSAIGMISRSNWKPEFSLVGHNSTVVRFAPKLFHEEKKAFNIIASAGVDKSVAVWNTTFQRPLFTAAEVATMNITDLQWSSDSLTLFVGSETLVVFSFEQEELGAPVEEHVLADMITKLKVPEPLHSKLPPAIDLTESPVKASRSESASIPPEDKSEMAVDSPSSTPLGTRGPESTTTTEAPSHKHIEPTIVQAPVTQKDGKKRIAPTLVSSVNGKPASTITTLQLASSSRIDKANTTMEFDAPSYAVPKDLKKREQPELTEEQAAKRRKDVEPVEFIGSVAINPSTSFSKVRISTPKIRSSFALDSPNDDSLTLEIKNGTGNEQKPTRISLIKNGTKLVFTDFIPKLAGLAAGGEGYFWAVSSVDGVLYVYSDGGRRIFPPLVLGTPFSFLEAKGKYLLAVTSLGEVYAWDVEAKKALFEPTSLYPLLTRSNADLLTRAENLTLCSISSGGVPVATISNGNGYLYDAELDSWMLISDSWWAFGSQYWDSRDSKDDGSIVNMLERKTNDEIVRRGRGKFLQKMAKTMLMKEGYESMEKVISLAHLENRILTSLRLKDEVEFKTYLIIYCKRVSEMGYKARLLEVFEDLMGPDNVKDDPSWEPKVLSYDKRELLKEVIFACAHIRVVQRILVQFATALNILDKVSL